MFSKRPSFGPDTRRHSTSSLVHQASDFDLRWSIKRIQKLHGCRFSKCKVRIESIACTASTRERCPAEAPQGVGFSPNSAYKVLRRLQVISSRGSRCLVSLSTNKEEGARWYTPLLQAEPPNTHTKNCAMLRAVRQCIPSPFSLREPQSHYNEKLHRYPGFRCYDDPRHQMVICALEVAGS